jgi:hypothetical protein
VKGRFSISVVSEDLPKESCKGEIRVRDNKLRKIVDRVEFMIPKSLLSGLKATFDGRETETRIMLNWKVKF